jgi:hypothetical protein
MWDACRVRRQRRVGLLVAVIVGAAAGCGSTQVTKTTSTTVSMLCGDSKQSTTPIGVSGDPSSPLDSAEGQRAQYKATLPYWERLQQDAPDEVAATLATIVDHYRRAANIDPSLTSTQALAAVEAIVDEPSMLAAITDWGDFVRSACHPGEQETTATR